MSRGLLLERGEERERERDCFPPPEKTQQPVGEQNSGWKNASIVSVASMPQTAHEISHLGPNFQAQHFAEYQMHSNGYFHGD